MTLNYERNTNMEWNSVNIVIVFFPIQRTKMEEEEYRERVITGNYDTAISTRSGPSWKRPKVKQSAYFSDEEDISDEGWTDLCTTSLCHIMKCIKISQLTDTASDAAQNSWQETSFHYE